MRNKQPIRNSLIIMDIDYYEGIISENKNTEKKIYEKFKKSMIQFITRRGGRQEIAEEIYNSAFIAIWQKTKLGKRPNRKYEEFLYFVVRAKWIDHLRSKESKEFDHLDSDNFEVKFGSTPMTEEDNRLIADIRFQDLVRHTLKELNSTCVKIIKRALSGISEQDIASELNLKINYVYKRKSECSKTLKQKVEQTKIFNELAFEFYG